MTKKRLSHKLTESIDDLEQARYRAEYRNRERFVPPPVSVSELSKLEASAPGNRMALTRMLALTHDFLFQRD